MWAYWLSFAGVSWLALSHLRPQVGVLSPGLGGAGPWRLVFVVLVLMIGLRHEVGGDWLNYLPKIEEAASLSITEVLQSSEPGYGLLNWLGAQLGLDIYLVNTVCALLFSWGLLVFCRAQPRPWLALAVAVPYLVTVVAMGYTRQGVAIGLAMGGLVALSQRKLLVFVLLVVVAALFHKSAVILMPLAALASTRRRVWTVFWVAGASAMFYALLLQDALEGLRSGYLEAEFQSEGTMIRLLMNAVPALLFLVFRRRFEMPEDLRSFWSWMSWFALGFWLLLVLSPSSTAVDRVALYWIPLQLFVLSRLPNALGSPRGSNKFWVQMVVLYSSAVLGVWLFFAANAYAWLPYQFYPWVAFWS